MRIQRTKVSLRELGPIFVPVLGIAVAVIGMVLILSSLIAGCGGGEGAGEPPTGTEAKTAPVPEGQKYTFGTPTKAAHYESNSPAHEAVLPAPPINVVINFNFDLAPPSRISVMSNGKEYGTGETVIDPNKLSMRREVDPQAPDGLYEVAYTACWPDQTCHDGSFQFAINRSLAASFTDMRNRPEVAIRMSDISFQPDKVLIGRGTKVTWTNGDTVEHFVNTDTHPAHTYFLEQNSRGLAPGSGTFSQTFTQPGAYPYHCSAHADRMSGMIVVE